MGEHSQAALLLRKQLAELNKNPVEGFSAGLIDDEDIFRWEVSSQKNESSNFFKTKYRVQLRGGGLHSLYEYLQIQWLKISNLLANVTFLSLSCLFSNVYSASQLVL